MSGNFNQPFPTRAAHRRRWHREYTEQDHLSFDDDPDPDFDSAADDCGLDPDSGLCTLAGTEFCDWDCPFSY